MKRLTTGWTVRRGDIYLADLGKSKHTDRGKIRPVLIFQNDMLNRMVEEGLYEEVIIIPLSSRIRQNDFTYVLSRRERLTKESAVLCHAVKMITAKRILTEEGKLAVLTPQEMREIEVRVLSAMGVER